MRLNGDCVLHYKYKKTTPTPPTKDNLSSPEGQIEGYVGVLRSLADEEVQHTTQTQDYYSKSCSLFRVLRHRTPSSPIGLSEVTEQALRLIARILLIQRKKKYPSRKEKSAFT